MGLERTWIRGGGLNLGRLGQEWWWIKRECRPGRGSKGLRENPWGGGLRENMGQGIGFERTLVWVEDFETTRAWLGVGMWR